MSSSIKNRTFEFHQCVSSFDKINKKNKQQPQRTPQGPTKKSQFSQHASVIAKDITRVTDMLSKLALLAKRKPLFDDNPVEIGELTYVIKQDIFKIEQNIQNLQKFMKGDTSIQIDSQTSQFSKNVVTLLNSKMKNVSGEFKNVLETRQRNEILNKNRTENFLSSTNVHHQKQNGGDIGRTKSPLTEGLSTNENPYLMSTPSTNQHTQDEISGTSSNPYSNDYLSIPNQSQQLMLMEEQSSEYLQLRNRAVETIESTINEVGNLFLQLATMVSEQGEQIQRIDENVEDISLNISGAQKELLKYYAHISSNRWLFLKIFGVLILFFFLWVMVS